jgi:hypothetical protein
LFGFGEVFDFLSKIRSRRRRHTHRKPTEFYAVQIFGNDPLFRIFPADSEGECRFFDFPNERPFIHDAERAARESHFKGRGAFYGFSGPRVPNGGPYDSDRVDTGMERESPIFERDERLTHEGRNLVFGKPAVPRFFSREDFSDFFPVSVQENERLRPFWQFEREYVPKEREKGERNHSYHPKNLSPRFRIPNHVPIVLGSPIEASKPDEKSPRY